MVLAEDEVVRQPHNIILILWVFLHQVLEVLGFFMSELMVHLGVASDLDSDGWEIRIRMVDTLDDLGEAALAERLDDFKSITDMGTRLNLQVAFMVVIQRIALILAILLFRVCLLLLEFLSLEAILGHNQFVVKVGALDDVAGKVYLLILIAL